MNSGVNGISYDFWEVVPAKISGYVFQDGPTIVVNKGDPEPNIPALRDGKLTPDDKRLAGVVLELCDGSGYPLTDAQGNHITAVTDANGYYEFTMLMPGAYSVVETQPSGYVPGIDTVGSKGGLVVNTYSKPDATVMSLLAVDPAGSADRADYDRSGRRGGAIQFQRSAYRAEQSVVSAAAGLSHTDSAAARCPRLAPRRNFWARPSIACRKSCGMDIGRRGASSGYTWHLSVIDAGQPRQENSGADFVQAADNTIFDPVSWSGDRSGAVAVDPGRPERHADPDDSLRHVGRDSGRRRLERRRYDQDRRLHRRRVVSRSER